MNLVVLDSEGVVGPDDLREFIGPFALFMIEQALFDAAEDDVVVSFDGPLDCGWYTEAKFTFVPTL